MKFCSNLNSSLTSGGGGAVVVEVELLPGCGESVAFIVDVALAYDVIAMICVVGGRGL